MTQEKTLQHAILLTISVVYVLLIVLFASEVPNWQTPDEPAHYNYIGQIVAGDGLPIIENGDWDQAYLDALKRTRFTTPLMDDFDMIEYEDHQPPLYYLLMTPVYSLTDGSLTAIRVVTGLIGLIIVWSAYGVGRLMFPQRPWIGLGAAAFVAFQPQHVHILASVNNDALGWAVIGVTLYLIVAYLKSVPVYGIKVVPWHLGLLVGIGFVTKSTTYFMAGVALLAIALCIWTRHRQMIEEDRELTFPEEMETLPMPYEQTLAAWMQFLIPALALGLLWWGRNLIVYGVPDFLGLGAHDAVVVGQPRTDALIDRLGTGGFLEEMARVTFNSFWGQFGWMALPLEARFYTIIRAALLFAFGGLAVDMALLRPRANTHTSRDQRNVWFILVAVTVLSILAFLYYNTEFQQHQGRYMFPLLIPLGIWLTLGLDAWWRLLLTTVQNDEAERPLTWMNIALNYGVVLAFLPLAVFDIWQLYRVIAPNL